SWALARSCCIFWACCSSCCMLGWPPPGITIQLLVVGRPGRRPVGPSVRRAVGRSCRSARAYVVAAAVAPALFRVSPAGRLYLITAIFRAEKAPNPPLGHPLGGRKGPGRSRISHGQ